MTHNYKKYFSQYNFTGYVQYLFIINISAYWHEQHRHYIQLVFSTLPFSVFFKIVNYNCNILTVPTCMLLILSRIQVKYVNISTQSRTLCTCYSRLSTFTDNRIKNSHHKIMFFESESPSQQISFGLVVKRPNSSKTKISCLSLIWCKGQTL